jgi:hypothetical protein
MQSKNSGLPYNKTLASHLKYQCVKIINENKHGICMYRINLLSYT